MTRLNAQRLLHQHGQKGNWRFKGLLLAALPETGVSMKDVAEAWPQHAGDYRFLQRNRAYDPAEAPKERIAAELDSPEHHFLQTFAKEVTEENKDHKLATAPLDKAIKHALFAAATVEEVDQLFRDQLADVVAEGAQRRQAARNGAFVFNSDTRNGTIPVADDRAYTFDSSGDGIAEGAIIPDEREGYSTVSWSCKKVGVGARITDEMIDHALIDIIERQVRWVGEVTENDINRIWLVNLLDNAGGDFDTAGTDQGVPGLNGAVTTVDNADFIPDTFVSHPEFRQALFDDSNLVLVNQSGSDTELRERELQRVMGVEHLAMNDAAYDGTGETWGYAADGEKGAVVYQKDHVWLVINRDIEIKDYEDPIRDLQGVNARAWVDSVYAQPNAAATVQF